MDELLEQFLLEGRDLVAQATADLEVLQIRPDDAVALDSAFRAIHTLKGSVAIFAFVPAESLLHAMEDMLELTRKHSARVEAETLSILVACIDTVDRWIDEVERVGSLPDDAAATAERLVGEMLGYSSGDSLSSTAAVDKAAPEDGGWTSALLDRRGIEPGAARTLTVFRYAPDADCFFRGEDPLAIALAVPQLLSLGVAPAAGHWPAEDDIEPFRCISILEGVSTADPAAVTAAFRMVRDQATIAAANLHPGSDADALPSREARGADMLRVSAARVDALADGLGELMVAVNAMASLSDAAEPIDRRLAAEIRAVQARLEQVTGRMHRDVSAVRAVTLEASLRRLPRMVREIADSLGKQVTFAIRGQDTEVDKQIADGLFEPLLHLLRNAIDHGAELPAQRLASGKDPSCRIALDFRRSGDSILATISDDGRGIDPAMIRSLAVDREVVPPEEAQAMSDAAALRLIFAPGFSTAEQVTSVSGRGVGMDAVQTAIERLRGTIEVESAVGAGTSFKLRLPVNALTTRLLVVETGNERYGVALDQIIETVRVKDEALRAVGDGKACVLRGRTVPVVSLGALLGASERQDAVARMLVTEASGDRVALRVDGFAERLDAFVRAPSGLLAAVPGVTGSTLLGDGNVLLILDLPELLA